MANVELIVRLSAELFEEAGEFDVLTDDVIATLIRGEVDRRVMEFVNEEIRIYRTEKAQSKTTK